MVGTAVMTTRSLAQRIPSAPRGSGSSSSSNLPVSSNQDVSGPFRIFPTFSSFCSIKKHHTKSIMFTAWSQCLNMSHLGIPGWDEAYKTPIGEACAWDPCWSDPCRAGRKLNCQWLGPTEQFRAAEIWQEMQKRSFEHRNEPWHPWFHRFVIAGSWHQ